MAISNPTIANAWYLTGPTAAGKTAVGIELAKRIDAEIISLDSMALYRGMDVGTAKPTMAERRDVPHHLIDILEPSQEFSVAQYLDAAEKTAAEISSRGKQVLFVGGTALYLKALLRGLFSGPTANWELRRDLEEIARLNGPESLHVETARSRSCRRGEASSQRRAARDPRIGSAANHGPADQSTATTIRNRPFGG